LAATFLDPRYKGYLKPVDNKKAMKFLNDLGPMESAPKKPKLFSFAKVKEWSYAQQVKEFSKVSSLDVEDHQTERGCDPIVYWCKISSEFLKLKDFIHSHFWCLY